MESFPRHQCLIYQGPPSRQLPGLAAAARSMLEKNYRCLYLNSPPMVAGMRSYLAAQGVDVAIEVKKGSLVLSSDQQHLDNGSFDVDRMLSALEEALQQALKDGYQGLWATGDMTWEMGPQKDFSKLMEYEWRLEQFFRQNPGISGICQYHADTLPNASVLVGLQAHASVFISETLTLMNPHYVYPPPHPPRQTIDYSDPGSCNSFPSQMDSSN